MGDWSEAMLGNVRKMLVESLENGCEYMLSSGLNSEDILGYGGPARFYFGIPWAASCCRLWRKPNSMASGVIKCGRDVSDPGQATGRSSLSYDKNTSLGSPNQ